MREQHQDERGERDEVDQDVCERRDEENELGRDGGDENECVQGCAHLYGRLCNLGVKLHTNTKASSVADRAHLPSLWSLPDRAA